MPVLVHQRISMVLHAWLRQLVRKIRKEIESKEIMM